MTHTTGQATIAALLAASIATAAGPKASTTQPIQRGKVHRNLACAAAPNQHYNLYVPTTVDPSKPLQATYEITGTPPLLIHTSQPPLTPGTPTL